MGLHPPDSSCLLVFQGMSSLQVMTPPQMRAASWDCHRSVLRNDTHAGRTLDPTAPYEPIRSRKEYTAFRCPPKSGSPLPLDLWNVAEGCWPLC